jgi:hypothetical protein
MRGEIDNRWTDGTQEREREVNGCAYLEEEEGGHRGHVEFVCHTRSFYQSLEFFGNDGRYKKESTRSGARSAAGRSTQTHQNTRPQARYAVSYSDEKER